MSQALWSEVDDYFTGMLAPPDPALEAALEASATALQTVGSKGHDGFVLALVTAATA